MDTSELDERLRASAPRGLSDDPDSRFAALDAVAEARIEAVRRPHAPLRKRVLIGVPAAALGVIVLLTAGAVVVDNLVPVITTIPVSYTTDTGTTITCHLEIDGGGETPNTTRAIAKYMKAQDWTGVGQRIYDYAIAHPSVPNPKDSYVDEDGVEHQGSMPMTPAERDNDSWDRATSAVIYGSVPESLIAGPEIVSLGWGSQDCHGVLH